MGARFRRKQTREASPSALAPDEDFFKALYDSMTFNSACVQNCILTAIISYIGHESAEQLKVEI